MDIKKKRGLIIISLTRKTEPKNKAGEVHEQPNSKIV
jgi:hypothetical protein